MSLFVVSSMSSVILPSFRNLSYAIDASLFENPASTAALIILEYISISEELKKELLSEREVLSQGLPVSADLDFLLEFFFGLIQDIF